MGIERDLHDLLYCHDCVIVPHWGGFLTHYRSARLDEVNQLVHPPGKDISFNKNLDRNDGLLADHVAKREGKPFREAQQLIDDAVKEWRRTLIEKGRLELPHIGIFYRDQESNLQFDPDRRSNFLKEAFGLRPVAAIPAPAERPIFKVISPVPVKKAASLPERRTTLMWAAAATTAVIFGAAAIFAYRYGESTNVQWSSFDPFANSVHRVHVPAEEAPEPIREFIGFDLPAEPLGVKVIELPAKEPVRMIVDLGMPAPIEVPETTKVEVKAAPRSVASAKARFHVIGGCFAQEENADRFLAELIGKGYEAKRLSKHGDLHPVAFGSYTRKADAVEAIAAMKAEGVSAAWLLVR